MLRLMHQQQRCKERISISPQTRIFRLILNFSTSKEEKNFPRSHLNTFSWDSLGIIYEILMKRNEVASREEEFEWVLSLK